MRCEAMQELFSPYLDKMTNTKENQTLEAHLQVCPLCQEKLEQMRILCALLKNLDIPPMPEGFAADFNKRLQQEKIIIFPKREMKIPAKPNWLVTGVAGIALSMGVFLSSYLPWATMTASLQNWVDKDKPTTVAVGPAIGPILERFTAANKDVNIQGETTNANNVAQITANGGYIAGRTNKGTIVASKPTASVNLASNNSVVNNEPRIADLYSSKIKVEDMSTSLQEVIQLASANGGEYALLPSASLMGQDSSGANVKVISIQVPKDKVNQVLGDLEKLGASNPNHDTKIYTQEYINTANELTSLANEIKALESRTDLTADDQVKLKELKEKQASLQNSITAMDKELNLVTIEVHLIAEAGQ